MKRNISFFLLLAMLMAGCGSGNAQTDETNAVSNDTDAVTEAVTEDPYLDNLPADLRFDGKTFDIYTYQGGNLAATVGRNYYNLAVHEENGDVLNDAGYRVTTEVEERFGITLTCAESNDTAIAVPTMKKLLLAGDSTYELFMPFTLENFVPLLSENLLYDIASLEHVDLTREYYVQDAIELYTVADKVITITGSYAMPSSLPLGYLYNKKAAADLDIENMYDLVRSGAWTHDKFMEIIRDTYRDLNGNGKPDDGDFYGYHTYGVGPQYLYCSYDGTTVKADGDGFKFGFDSEHAVRIMEKVIALRTDRNAGYYDKWDVFFGGNALFCFYLSGPDPLRDLDFDFGLLPVPKLDENQEQYRIFSSGGMLVVPIHQEDANMTGAIIEALYATAHKYMPEAITEHYIEGKLLQSEDDIEMFRLLNSNEVRAYDLARNYDASNGIIQNFALINKLVTKKSTDIMSSWAAVESKVTTAFEDLYQNITEQ